MKSPPLLNEEPQEWSHTIIPQEWSHHLQASCIATVEEEGADWEKIKDTKKITRTFFFFYKFSFEKKLFSISFLLKKNYFLSLFFSTFYFTSYLAFVLWRHACIFPANFFGCRFVAISSYMYHCTGHYLVHVQWYKNVVNFALFELFFGQNSTMVRNWTQIPIHKIMRDMKRHAPDLIELDLTLKNEK